MSAGEIRVRASRSCRISTSRQDCCAHI